jgi:hypothetical protein
VIYHIWHNVVFQYLDVCRCIIAQSPVLDMNSRLRIFRISSTVQSSTFGG